jgi:SRSO17 transposase
MEEAEEGGTTKTIHVNEDDNCQVGVFLGYALWNYRTLIDRRLHLPEDRVDDPHRRARCSVPEAITFKTKAELGLDMLLNARKSV